MKIDKPSILESLKSLPLIFETYIRNIPDDSLDKKRNKDTWTIREHVYHIVEVQEMLYKRMQKIKREEHPEITPYFPDDKTGRGNLYKSIEHAPFRVFNFDPSVMNTSMQKEIRESDIADFPQKERFIKYKNEGKLLEPSVVAESLKRIIKNTEMSDIRYEVGVR